MAPPAQRPFDEDEIRRLEKELDEREERKRHAGEDEVQTAEKETGDSAT